MSEIILIAKCKDTEIVHTLGVTLFYNLFEFEGVYKGVKYLGIKSKVDKESELLTKGKDYAITGGTMTMPVETANLYIKQSKAREISL